MTYKKYYDNQAQAHPLKIHTYCLLLNPKLDTQKQPMNKMLPKWLALYRVEQKMSNENYLVREVGTNHTQIVHRIRLRSYTTTHKITDIPNIDKNNFVTDPKFTDEYKQPALFDKTQHSLLWHPKMSDAPETDDINPDQTQPDHYDTIYLRKPQVRLQRLPANIDNTTLPPRKYDSIHTQVPIKLTTPDTTIKRILKPTTANTNQGPFTIHVPHKRIMPTSPITKVQDKARKAVEASMPRVILRRIKARRGVGGEQAQSSHDPALFRSKTHLGGALHYS